MEKKTRQKGETGFISLLGLFSLICFIASAKLFISAPKLSGEGTVPALCSLVMLITCVILLAELKNASRPYEDKITSIKKLKEIFAFLFPGKVGVIVIYCVLYAVALGFIGFAVSSFLFLAFSMLTLNNENRVRMLVISAAATVCILVVFQYIFQVQLP